MCRCRCLFTQCVGADVCITGVPVILDFQNTPRHNCVLQWWGRLFVVLLGLPRTRALDTHTHKARTHSTRVHARYARTLDARTHAAAFARHVTLPSVTPSAPAPRSHTPLRQASRFAPRRSRPRAAPALGSAPSRRQWRCLGSGRIRSRSPCLRLAVAARPQRVLCASSWKSTSCCESMRVWLL